MNSKRSVGLVMFFSTLVLRNAGFAQKDVGYLKVDADPGRTGVFVDDKYLGPAANFRVDRKYSLSPGQHTLRLSEPRYQDFTTTVNIEAGKTTKVKQAMAKLPLPEPPFGMLKIVKGNHSKFTGVFLNQHFMGHVGEYDNSLQGQLLKAGDYDLKVVSPEGQTIHEEKISIKENQTTVVNLK
jgi:PEGA domain-containing protein